jgi:hypothetical protein
MTDEHGGGDSKYAGKCYSGEMGGGKGEVLGKMSEPFTKYLRKDVATQEGNLNILEMKISSLIAKGKAGYKEGSRVYP